MKIAVIGPTHPYRGGLSHFTTLLVRALRRRHAVSFYSYTRQYPRWLFPGSTDVDPSAETLIEPCERTIDSLNPITWQRTARRIVADRPDLLLLQWWTPFWLPLYAVVARAARRSGIPVLFLCHQLVEPDSSPAEWKIARLGLGLGQGFVTMTGRERVMLAGAFPGRPVAGGFLPVFDQLPSRGMSRAEARAQFGVDEAAHLLLFFGFVRRYKGLAYLFEALARLPNNVKLLVAGEFWEDAAAYQAQIARLGLADRVIIHDRYVPNEAIEPYFAAADALVLPYLSGSQSGVGMLAVNYGLPVIASNIGGLAETIIDDVSGYIVPPADSPALAAAIARLLDAATAQRLRAGMRQVRERRSWDALIDILEATAAEIGARVRHPARQEMP